MYIIGNFHFYLCIYINIMKMFTIINIIGTRKPLTESQNVL